MITTEIKKLIDRYNWYMKHNSDNDKEAEDIYTEADILAKKYNMNREDFWFTYFI